MLCKKPFHMKGANFGCGQCMPCRFNRRRIWTHRIALEAAVHAASTFLTLTYDKAHLPLGGTLVPRDMQLFLKRLRKRAGVPIRFFGVGEYGDQSFRPHYHLAVFGLDPGSRFFKECWDYGFVYPGSLTLDSAQYVAGYVTKKMTGKDDARLGGRYPEFARMSLRPGIGAPAVSDVVQALQTDMGQRAIVARGDVPSVLRQGGRSLPLGRYMRGRIREAIGHRFIEENPDETFRRTAEMLNLYKDYLLSTEAPLSLAAWKARRDAQKVLNMETKARIYGQRSTL